MKELLIIGTCFLLTSCLKYKEATKEKIDEVKKETALVESVKIPDEWLLSKDSAANTNFNYKWINELYNHELDSLISQGLKYNSDILIAQEKLNQIEIAMDIAGANLYPSVNAVANTTNNLVSGSKIENLGLKANWELDIWGKNKANKMASVGDYFSAKYLKDKLEQTISGMIAKTYFLSVAGNIQEEKIASYLQLTRELEKLYEVQHKVGAANDLDLSNIKSEIILTQGYLENIKNANKQSRRTLEILTGKYPEGKLAASFIFKPLENAVPETFPLQLIENRPDILANHYLIEKTFYEIQEADAARLPSVNISASLGAARSNVEGLNSLFSNPLINVGGGLVSPIFNGGKLKKNVEIKTSEEKRAVEEYAKSVLNAMNELESSWANVLSVEKQMEYISLALFELEKNIKLTQKQINLGTANNFELIQKRRSLLKQEMGLVDLELQDRIERINLYLALGAPQFSANY